MPWVVRGRAGITRALGAIAWATAVVAATGVLGVGAGGPGTGSVLLGAAAAVGVALARAPGRAGAPVGPGVA
jgi:hypothetical protein